MYIGVTTCLNYSQYLKITLPANIKFFDKFYVITSSTDKETIEVCKELNNNKVVIVETEAFFEKGAGFYKSKALNVVLDTLDRQQDLWCVILDADIIIPECFKAVELDTLSKDNIYSYKREKGNTKFNDTFVVGYFQLFNTSSHYYLHNYDLQFITACGGDVIFSAQWPQSNNIIFDTGIIKHISIPSVDWCGTHTELKNNINQQECVNKALELQQTLSLTQISKITNTTLRFLLVTKLKLIHLERVHLKRDKANKENLKAKLEEIKIEQEILQSTVQQNNLSLSILVQTTEDFINNHASKIEKIKLGITQEEKTLQELITTLQEVKNKSIIGIAPNLL